jgi:predicted transcriptional regulator
MIWGEQGRMLFDNKRSESEIIYELLSSAQEDIKKTRLMYKTNMTYSQFSKYLDYLIKKDLLEEKDSVSNGKIYQVTESGKKLLEPLNIMFDYLK